MIHLFSNFPAHGGAPATCGAAVVPEPAGEQGQPPRLAASPGRDDEPSGCDLPVRRVVLRRNQAAGWTVRLLLAAAAIFSPAAAAAQTAGSITGQVTGEGGRPLQGAQVMIVDTQNGAITDAAGRYTIREVAPGRYTVRASLLGFAAATADVVVATGAIANAHLALEPQAVALEGIVAVGYGTQSRRDLTGAVASIEADEVHAGPVGSVEQVLRGRASGVQVTQSNGAPGAGVSVRIRGSNSISANSEPLYVIDGVPAFVGSTGDARQINPLADLSPADIERIEVLKDASATAIYGSRGANGVILVTTRRGRPGENTVRVESSYGMQNVSRQLDMLNAREYAVLLNEAQTNVGRPALYTEEQIQGFGEGTNWQEEIFEAAPVQSHTLTFSGGDASTRYLVSGGFFDQQGVIVGSGFRRYSARLNLDREVGDRLRIGNSLTLSRTHADRARTDYSTTHGVVAAALGFPPTVPVRDEEGMYSEAPFLAIANPVATTLELTDDRTASRIIGDLFGEYDLTDALRFRTSVGGSAFFERERYYAPSFLHEGRSAQGSASAHAYEAIDLVNDNILTYGRSVASDYALDLTGGFTVQTRYAESLGAASQQFATDVTGAHNLGTGAEPQNPSSGVNEWGLVSWLGRANYQVRDRYLATLTGRYDGSSKFGANNKWGFFPSGALAWRVSEEPFLRDMSAISDLKLRTSYGITGNQEIGTYASVSRLSVYDYAWGDVRVLGYAPSGQAPNPDLRWETTRQFDIGFDLGLLDDRVVITGDYYRSRTNDLLLSVPMPANSGFSSQLRNVGSLRNEGVELQLSTVNVERGDLGWRTSLNLSTNANEVVDLGEADRIFVGGGLSLGNTFDSDDVTLLQVGQPLGIFYGYRTDGIYQIGDLCPLTSAAGCTPGERRFVDENGDGAITPEDRVLFADPNPDFHGGMSNAFTLGPIDLNVFLTGSYGNRILNAMSVRVANVTGGVNERAEALDRWTPENPSDRVPRANVSRDRRLADVFVEDGSYLRLQDVTLGYNLPAALRMGAGGARLYLNGQNLWTWTSYSGYDPEVNSFGGASVHRGIDNGTYPRSRTVGVGLNVTF